MKKKTTKKTAGKSFTAWATRWTNPTFLTKVGIVAQRRSDLERAFRKISATLIFDPAKCTKVKITKI